VNDRVLDASALVLALNGKTDEAGLLRARLPRMRRHAPHLIDAELGNVLRRHVQAARITAEEAGAALRAARVLIDHRYPHAGSLAELAWTLRDDLSFYDALYVALAGRLGVPLVTCDSRLSKAPGLPCAVEVVV
jgi:predicted nucleic acid-binding protein